MLFKSLILILTFGIFLLTSARAQVSEDVVMAKLGRLYFLLDEDEKKIINLNSQLAVLRQENSDLRSKCGDICKTVTLNK